MNLIFIAPPAAGKGTFADLLKKKYNYTHISTGDVLREEIKNNTTIGKEVSEVIKSGKLINDDLMKRLIEKKLSTLDTTKPFIMDGYPRTITQVKDYEEILENTKLEMGKVIYLNIDKETGLNRVLGRLICNNCKKSYNKFTEAKPKVEWICDECNTELINRSDDTFESYTVRYDTYINETKPILDYYKKLGNLIEIDASLSVESTMKEIEKWLV